MDLLSHNLDAARALADLVMALAGTAVVLGLALTFLERWR